MDSRQNPPQQPCIPTTPQQTRSILLGTSEPETTLSYYHGKISLFAIFAPQDGSCLLKDNNDIQFLIIGAGHARLLAGGRLVVAGFSAENMCLVDVAGGFAGTWHWNRYPGLQCDVESYIYMPFLEETGYKPTQKYATGEEIRQHCERVASHFRLRGQFSTRVLSATWNDERRRWIVRMRNERSGEEMTLFAQF